VCTAAISSSAASHEEFMRVQEERAKEEEQLEEEAGAGMAKDVDDTPLDTRRLKASEKDAPPPA
jgi:hypothetical protein